MSTIFQNVDNRWLPADLHDQLWSKLEDPTALSEGDIIFDLAQHAHFAGEILHITEANETTYFVIRWMKGADNIIHDSIPMSRFAKMLLLWIDPCEQEPI